jgi:hypothetical protein
MAAANLITTGVTAATSADIVVAATPVIVALKGITGQPYIEVQLKDDAAAYNGIGGLSKSTPSMVLSAAGTYRLSRPAGDGCGAFSG